MFKCMLTDLKREVPVGVISAKFHNALADIIAAVAKRSGQTQVALSGGCFQNRHLTERTAARLEREGIRPFWHQRIPPNDGGISLGQIVAARMGLEQR
jgi:hydrogenase maturation protein HypF